MKVIVCDVGNAASSFVVADNGNTMMIDCGSNAEKDNPIDVFLEQKNWTEAKPYVTQADISYPLTLLHISHPDDDHVRNAADVKKRLTPYLLKRLRYEDFPDGDTVNGDYVKEIDKVYRGDNPEEIDWGFEINEVRNNSIETCKNNSSLKDKVRNNSSIIRYIKDNGVTILFCGDLEKAGWEVLLNDNPNFVRTLRENGVNILIAPHHGHKSGFPKALFDVIGNVDVVIHSKDTEASKDGTDVSNQYTGMAKGHDYFPLSDQEHYYKAKVLTTRSNGHIYISTLGGGMYKIYTQTASPNHEKFNL